MFALNFTVLPAQQVYQKGTTAYLVGKMGDTLFKAEKIILVTPANYLVEREKKKGLIDARGQIMIPLQYEDLAIDHELSSRVSLNRAERAAPGKKRVFYFYATSGSKKGLLNSEGKELAGAVYDKIDLLNWSGKVLWRVRLNKLYGVIDTSGKQLVDLKYSMINKFDDNDYLFPVAASVNGSLKYGIIDTSGREVIPCSYGFISSGRILYHLFHARNDMGEGYVDIRTNTVRIPLIYRYIRQFDYRHSRDAIVWALDMNGNWGTIDTANVQLTGFVFKEQGTSFFKGTSVIKGNDKYGLINRQGQFVAPPIYDELADEYASRCYDEWYMYFKRGMETGYLNDQFKEIISPLDTPGAIPVWGNVNVPAGLPMPLIYAHADTSIDNSKCTINTVLNDALHAIVSIPAECRSICAFQEHIAYYGLVHMLFMGSQRNDYTTARQFKQQVVFKIIASENMRNATWSWLMPYLKKCFGFLSPLHQREYKKMLRALKHYMNNYDLKKVNKLLQTRKDSFSHDTWTTETNPAFYIRRSITSAVDRLIVYHKLISAPDANRWITKIADTVERW